MEWRTAANAALLGADADAAMAWAQHMTDCGLWLEGHVMRWRTSTGAAAWLWLTDGEALSCSAIAPWDDVWKVDAVPGGTFYASETPKGWRTKGTEGLTKHPIQRITKEARPIVFEVGGWCAGTINRKVTQLARVAALTDDGKLARVILDPDVGPMEVCAIPVKRWWPVDKWARGFEILWDRGQYQFANYRFLCICAANEERREAKRVDAIAAAIRAEREGLDE